MIPIRESVTRALVARWDGAPLTSRGGGTAAAQAGDVAFAARSRPLIHDGGPWRGPTTEEFIARFRNPLYLGNRRRRADRIIQPTERTVAA